MEGVRREVAKWRTPSTETVASERLRVRVTVMRNAAFSASLSGQGLDASSLWMRRASGVVATRSVAAAALAGVVACVTGLVWRQDRMGGLDLLDRRCWYTPGATAALFDDLERLDAKARFVYSPTGLIIDMAFPVAYGLLLASLLFRLWPGGVPLYLLPSAMAAADVLENATVAALALGHAGALSPLASLAAVFILVKTILIAATATGTGIGTIRWLWVRVRQGNAASNAAIPILGVVIID